MTNDTKQHIAEVVAFQQQIERERVAREQHELMQVDDDLLEQVLEDSDAAEHEVKKTWFRMRLSRNEHVG